MESKPKSEKFKGQFGNDNNVSSKKFKGPFGNWVTSNDNNVSSNNLDTNFNRESTTARSFGNWVTSNDNNVSSNNFDTNINKELTTARQFGNWVTSNDNNVSSNNLDTNFNRELELTTALPFENLVTSNDNNVSSNNVNMRNQFTIELMILGHGRLKTEQVIKHGAEEIQKFESTINLSMFSFASIGHNCLLYPGEDNSYRTNIVERLESIQSPIIDNITFANIINKSKSKYGQYRDRINSQSKINIGIKERSSTVLFSNVQPEKKFTFEDSNEKFKTFSFGVFILKTITFSDGFTIPANSNLLEMTRFTVFMKTKFNKQIIKYIPSNKRGNINGYFVLSKNIHLSEIIAFFELLNNNNEISSLNIFDLTCNSIKNPRTRRRHSKTEHNDTRRKSFGGKK
jgi:hypothetical protein